jgi:hypothetical protein
VFGDGGLWRRSGRRRLRHVEAVELAVVRLQLAVVVAAEARPEQGGGKDAIGDAVLPP